MSVTMQPTTRNFRYTALVSYFGLLAWMILWQFILIESEYSTAFVTVFYIAPLLFPFVGLTKGKPYTHAWVNFVILIYLTHALTVIYAVPSERTYAVIELILASTMFISCCGYARLRGRECGLALGKLKDEMAREKAMFEGGKSQ